MKLKVYQQGGGLIYTPFIPGRTESSISGSSGNGNGSSGDDSKIDPLDKELIALMKDQNLLPSDIQAIFNQLTRFQKRTQHLTSMGLGTDAYRSVMPGMLQIMKMVSIARNNKERYDKSVQLMMDREAGGEVALDGYGRMWVFDKENEKVTQINPSKYTPEKYEALSNSQLLDLRRSNPDLAFDDNSFETLGNDIIGMKQIQEEIAKVIKDFGKEKNEHYIPGNVQNLAKDIAERGYFKVGLENTRSLNDIKGFTELLWNSLGNNARNLLTARAALSGSDAKGFLADMIFKDADISRTQSFDASMTKAASASGAGGEGDEKLTDHDTYAERLATGQVEVGNYDFIMNKNNGSRLWTFVQNYGPAMSNGNAMETMSMEYFLQKFDASGIIDWSRATFGDYQISAIDLPKIMYKGGSSIKRVVLPIRSDGSINFKAQEEADKLQKWINEQDGVTDALIQERVSEIDGAYWDVEHKVIKFRNAKPFLAVDTISSSDKIRFDTKSPWVYNMEREEGDPRKDWLDLYESVLENGFIEKGKDKKYDFGSTAGRHLYEAVMFLPIISDTIGAAVYNDQNVPKSRYYDVRSQAIAHQRAETLIGNYQ